MSSEDKTLDSIAIRYDVSASELAKDNGIKKILKRGDEIWL